MVRSGCLLLVCAACVAQTSSLQELGRALLNARAQRASQETAKQMADTVMRSAERPYIPSHDLVQDLANALIRSLPASKLDEKQAVNLAAMIDKVLHSAGAATYRFNGVLNDFRGALERAGLARPEAQGITDRLRAVGMSVRGPQDLPLLELP